MNRRRQRRRRQSDFLVSVVFLHRVHIGVDFFFKVVIFLLFVLHFSLLDGKNELITLMMTMPFWSSPRLLSKPVARVILPWVPFSFFLSSCVRSRISFVCVS